MFSQGRGRIAALMAGAAFVALVAPRLVHAQTSTALPPIEANLAPAATTASAEQAITGEALLRRRGASADSMSIIENELGVSLYANGGISSLPATQPNGLHYDAASTIQLERNFYDCWLQP